MPINSPLLSTIQSILETAGASQSTITSIRQWSSLVAHFADHFSENGLNWRNFVEKLVYKPFDMANELRQTTLTSPRQAWATDVLFL